MNKKKVEVIVGETITNEPIKEFSIPVKNYTWIDRLLRRPKKRDFKLYKVSVRNMKRCATVAYKMPEIPSEISSLHELTRVVYPLINDHCDDVVYLIAVCLQNNSKQPSKGLINFIQDNLSSEDMFNLLIDCVGVSGLQSFFSATLLLKGVSVNIVKATVADRADLQG